jgi:hypothetical protein
MLLGSLLGMLVGPLLGKALGASLGAALGAALGLLVGSSENSPGVDTLHSVALVFWISTSHWTLV